MELYRDVQASLKFISRIRAGDKINVDQMSIYPVGWLSSIMRTLWYSDSRNKTLSFLHDSVNRALELIRCYEQNPTKYTSILRKNIIVDLEATKNGLENLKITYEDDLKFLCEVDTLVQCIDAADISRDDYPVFINPCRLEHINMNTSQFEDINLTDASSNV